MTKKSEGNVSKNGTVKVTASSIYRQNNAENAVDLHNNKNHFQTDNFNNSWLKFDFGERKIQLTSYSIRSRDDANIHHPKNWVVEGSNTDSDDWKILDSHNDDLSLRALDTIQTFKISNKSESNESFRFIRIRQTGLNTSNCYYLAFSAIEFFGTLFDLN